MSYGQKTDSEPLFSLSPSVKDEMFLRKR